MPLPAVDLGVEPLPERRVARPAPHGRRLITSSIACRRRMIVVAQPARLVVDHLLELRQPLGDRQDLVDLLLVLDRGEAHVGMRQHIGQFVGDRVGIDRHRNGAERLRRHDRPVEPRPVGADDGDGVAALEPEPREPDRIGAHLVQHLRPGPDLPDAEILVPVGGPAAQNGGHCGSGAWGTCPRERHRSPRQSSQFDRVESRGPRPVAAVSPADCCRAHKKMAVWARSSQHLV